MFKCNAIRIATIAALGALSVLWGAVWAESSPSKGAAATLEVKVLEVQPTTGNEALYRMEVISVLQSGIRVKPGDSIRVRSRLTGPDTPDQRLKPRGWIGTAYLNSDPRATGIGLSSQAAVGRPETRDAAGVLSTMPNTSTPLALISGPP